MMKKIFTILFYQLLRKSIGSHDFVPTMSFDNETPQGEKLSFNPFTSVKQNDFSDRPISRRESRRERTAVTDEDIDLVFSSLTKNIRYK